MVRNFRSFACQDTITRNETMKDSKDTLLAGLTTEARNPHTLELDQLDTLELVKLINAEDALVASAVESESENIARAIDVIAERLARGGRLVYVGAGTSGRLGVLDAAECPPTFNTHPDQVIGLIAGGPQGMTRAIEGAEDSPQQGVDDLASIQLSDKDVVVGIAASGRTPYVLGALDFARSVGAFAIGFSCNSEAALRAHADLSIIPVVGPEVLSGSTRLKAGTATKLVLNMLSTGAMVRSGKTWSNLMVDLQATNEKLLDRAVRIIGMITGETREPAASKLEECGGELKTAVVSLKLGISPEQARVRLDQAGGRLRAALESPDKIADEKGGTRS